MKNYFFTIIILTAFFLPITVSNAQINGNAGTTGTSGNAGTSEKINKGSTVTLPNPIGVDDPRIIVGNVIRLILGLVGSLALIFFIYGGLMWMTSAGNSDQVTKGRDTLVWATLGLIVIFASYTGVAFILQSLGGV